MTDVSRPHPARIYDYLLGGKEHYEVKVDRQAGGALTARAPEARMPVRPTRAFLRRAVGHVVGAGVRQILDVGTGLPATPNIHETAQEPAPDVRFAYVDNDPVVKAHADALLSDMGATGIVLADVGDPRAVVDHREVRRVIDFSEPVALFLVAVRRPDGPPSAGSKDVGFYGGVARKASWTRGPARYRA